MTAPRTLRKRTYNLRRIKASYAYSIPEVAALLPAHKNAVSRWQKEGLRANSDGRPYLFRGDELIRFLKSRQDGKKRKCAAHEFYCFKCHTPRAAALGIADIEILSPSRMRLKAICEVCDTAINKFQAVKNLPKIETRFHIHQLAGRHIIERADPSAMCALEAIGGAS